MLFLVGAVSGPEVMWFGVSTQRFAASQSFSPCRLNSWAAIAGVVYSISLRPGALRNGYDSLSQPAVTDLLVVGTMGARWADGGKLLSSPCGDTFSAVRRIPVISTLRV